MVILRWVSYILFAGAFIFANVSAITDKQLWASLSVIWLLFGAAVAIIVEFNISHPVRDSYYD